MHQKAQIKFNRHWPNIFFLCSFVVAVSCSFMEDSLNKSDSEETVNVSLASVCTDNNVSVSESLELNPEASELNLLVEYFIELQKQAQAESRALPVNFDRIPSAAIQTKIRALAEEAWNQSLKIGAKDDFLKDKMETPYYENLILEMLVEASLKLDPLNCYQAFFTYRYTPFKIGSDQDKIFKTQLFINVQNEDSPESCEILASQPIEHQEIHLCLDERKPETSGGTGSWDDDD